MLGVQGAGMRPAAAVAMAQGYVVRGSDDAKTGNLHDLDGLKIMHGGLQVGIPSKCTDSRSFGGSIGSPELFPDDHGLCKRKTFLLKHEECFQTSTQMPMCRTLTCQMLL